MTYDLRIACALLLLLEIPDCAFTYLVIWDKRMLENALKLYVQPAKRSSHVQISMGKQDEYFQYISQRTTVLLSKVVVDSTRS